MQLTVILILIKFHAFETVATINDNHWLISATSVCYCASCWHNNSNNTSVRDANQRTDDDLNISVNSLASSQIYLEVRAPKKKEMINAKNKTGSIAVGYARKILPTTKSVHWSCSLSNIGPSYIILQFKLYSTRLVWHSYSCVFFIPLMMLRKILANYLTGCCPSSTDRCTSWVM